MKTSVASLTVRHEVVVVVVVSITGREAHGRGAALLCIYAAVGVQPSGRVAAHKADDLPGVVERLGCGVPDTLQHAAARYSQLSVEGIIEPDCNALSVLMSVPVAGLLPAGLSTIKLLALQRTVGCALHDRLRNMAPASLCKQPETSLLLLMHSRRS